MSETSQGAFRTDTQAVSLEMETFHLFDLARCSKGSIEAAACAIGLAQRTSNDFIAAHRVRTLRQRRTASLRIPHPSNPNFSSLNPNPTQVRTLELLAGGAVLRALAAHPLPDDQGGGCNDADVRLWGSIAL
jgi:hypothetical protein